MLEQSLTGVQAERARNCARLGLLTEPDVLILGGGVNGVSTLRELALNGVSAVLIDSGDFCQGASGASTRMAHGGLRYLEGREFSLVAESARERNLLLKHAPHLVRPLEIIVPVNSRVAGLRRAMLRFLGLSQKPGPLSLVALSGALMIYGLLDRKASRLPLHKVARKREDFPWGLDVGTVAVVSYFDGLINTPEQLVFEMLAEASGANEHTVALNYMNWRYQSHGVFEISDTYGHGEWKIRPKFVINAAGAWVDAVNAKLGLRTNHVRGVKGAHILLRHEALHARMSGKAFYFHDGLSRMVIAIPVDGIVLMGTTEIDTPDPGDRRVAIAETDYLLQAISKLFADITVEPHHVVAVTTGIRPLQSTGGGTANRAGRDHALISEFLPDVSGAPLLSLVGGKWTTFRSFGEAAADAALAHLKRKRNVSTRNRDYPGAGAVTMQTRSPERLQQLVQRYGAIAHDIQRYCDAGIDKQLAGFAAYSHREIEWLIKARHVCRLEDLILRRTRLVLSGKLTAETVCELAGLLATALGKDQAWACKEAEDAIGDPRILGSAACEERDAA